MAKKSKKINKSKLINTTIPRRLLWLLLAAAWVFTVTSLISFSSADWPSHSQAPHNFPVTNWCGPAGAWIAYQIYFTLGFGVWLILIAAITYLIASSTGKQISDLSLRAIGVTLMALATSSFLALQLPSIGSFPEGAGGIIAIYSIHSMQTHFATMGTFLVILAVFSVGAILAADKLIIALPRALTSAIKYISSRNPHRILVTIFLIIIKPFSWIRRLKNTSTSKQNKTTLRHSGMVIQDDETDDPDNLNDDELEYEYEYVYEEDDTNAELEDNTQNSDNAINPQTLRDKINKLPITFASSALPAKPPTPPVQDLSGYQFPDIDLLVDPESNFNDEMSRIVRQQAEILETALRTYRIDAEVVGIDAGPVITLYEVQLAPGTKVSQINAISSDIARELKAQNIRVVPNTAGKSTVGIEVPNLKKEKVRLKELLTIAGSDIRNKMKLPMFLGKDASGNALIADLATMPHMLIAGTTGSGKSVCLNTIIMSFLFTCKPDQLKLILADPKMVEMSQFKKIPHLMCPVITDMEKTTAALEWCMSKMDERYALFAEAGCRDINTYNKFTWEELKDIFEPATEEEARIPKKLPRIVFIIDELADLIMTNKDVEGYIVRIAQKARAVGIHLILATQRPQANVVTGLIKSNMPCRIAFKVASGMDSRIVLDSKGAELLLGQGDMLFLTPGTNKLQRAQGTLVDDKEIRKSVRFLKDFASQSFEPQLMQVQASSSAPDAQDIANRDPLFNEAVKIVIETERGSVSLLQRRLTIGYSRASRLIEEMASSGIIGEYKGSQAREVMITLDEWESLQKQAQQLSQNIDDENKALGQTSWDNDDDDENIGVPNEFNNEYRN